MTRELDFAARAVALAGFLLLVGVNPQHAVLVGGIAPSFTADDAVPHDDALDSDRVFERTAKGGRGRARARGRG